MYTPPTQTRIIWVYFVLRQKFSYFEPLPLKTKGACYHSFTDSLSLKTIWAHQKISHSWFVSISPSLSTVLQIFPPHCVFESKFFVGLLLPVEFVVDLDGFGEWKKNPFWNGICCISKRFDFIFFSIVILSQFSFWLNAQGLVVFFLFLFLLLINGLVVLLICNTITFGDVLV